MSHTIKIVVTAVIDGESQSWSADATTDLNPYDLASTLSMGVRDQAGRALRDRADRLTRV
jgi:hypothetical protein